MKCSDAGLTYPALFGNQWKMPSLLKFMESKGYQCRSRMERSLRYEGDFTASEMQEKLPNAEFRTEGAHALGH